MSLLLVMSLLHNQQSQSMVLLQKDVKGSQLLLLIVLVAHIAEVAGLSLPDYD